jgi:hypothetical protein
MSRPWGSSRHATSEEVIGLGERIGDFAHVEAAPFGVVSVLPGFSISNASRSLLPFDATTGIGWWNIWKKMSID